MELQTPVGPEPTPTPPPTVTPPLPVTTPPKNKKINIILLVVLLSLLVSAGAYAAILHFKKPARKITASASVQTLTKTQTTPPSPASKVDLAKLPLGDGKHSSTPKVGYIMTCQTSFNDPGGAFRAGPWIDQANGTWDATKKIAVSGSVNWPSAKETISESASTLSVYTNALPNHHTGIFPIQSTDPAYQYDRNQGTITAQDFNFSFPLNPTVAASPGCIRGEVGVTLSGAILFDGFDAGGRDAVAWELQDDCSGHPNSIYHYHGYSPCIPDKSASNAHSDLIGYAFDGFGIYGTKGEGGTELSTADLDACHGHTHAVLWHGKMVTMYHYHMTRDFPYSVSCFKGTSTVTAPWAGPTQSARPIPQQPR